MRIFKNILHILVHIAMFAVLAVALCMDSNTTYRAPETPIQYMDGWQVTYATGETKPAEFPLDFKSQTIVLTNTLPVLHHGSILEVKSNYKSLKAEVNGVTVYESNLATAGSIETDTGHYVSLIPLGEEHTGQEIRLTVERRASGYNAQLKRICLTTTSVYGFQMFLDKIDYMIVSIVLLLMSVVSAVFWAVFRHKLADEKIHISTVLIWVSLFSLSMGIWILTEPHFLAIATGRFALSGILNYLALMLLPVSLMGMFASVSRKYHKQLQWILCFVEIGFVLEVILFVFLGVDLSSMLLMIHGTLILTLIAFFVFFVIGKEDFLKGRLLKIVVCAAGVLCAVTLYVYIRGGDFMVFAITAVVAFVMGVMAHGISELVRTLEKLQKYAQYKDYAMKDVMTGLGSRLAYSNFVEKHQNHIPQDMAVIYMDINGLKSINDTQGHLAGDEAISQVGQSLNEVFAPFGECFRMGGDEFLVVLCENEATVKALMLQLDDRLVNLCGEYINRLTVSHGVCYAADYPQLPLEELIKIADQNMYTKKRCVPSR